MLILESKMGKSSPSPVGEGGDSLDKGNVACDKRFAPRQEDAFAVDEV